MLSLCHSSNQSPFGPNASRRLCASKRTVTHGPDGFTKGVTMKEIPLSNSRSVATVSNADFKRLSRHTWRVCLRNGIRYAEAKVDGIQIGMHRLVKPGHSMVDHWDRNGLNNTRGNLRPCSRSQNQANSKKPVGGTSRYKGVSWKTSVGKWYAAIQVMKKSIHLGVFDDERKAALAYNRAAIQTWGRFARINTL